MQQLCYLEKAVGREVPCPEERCAFWDEGCVVAGIRPDLDKNPHLVEFLLTLRRRIEAHDPSAGVNPYALLPPGLR